jgi:hypothetical protein
MLEDIDADMTSIADIDRWNTQDVRDAFHAGIPAPQPGGH